MLDAIDIFTKNIYCDLKQEPEFTEEVGESVEDVPPLAGLIDLTNH